MSALLAPPMRGLSAAVLTIDLDAVAANTRLFASLNPLMAVVKADGFGHGAVDVARVALAHGATRLGVATIDEALRLRDAGIAAPILSWLFPVDADLESALRRRVELAAGSVPHLRAIVAAASRLGVRARVHLHVDTGMARDGAPEGEWPALFALAAQVEVVGIMGHLAGAGDGLAAFERAVTAAKRLRPRLRHLAATDATLLHPGSRFDLSRVGAGLYGISAVPDQRLRHALRLEAPVLSVRDVPAGTPVGYGHSYRTAAPTRLATVGIGYGDGLPRAASPNAQVLLHGRRRRVAGLLSMDQFVVDAGDACVEPGDTVVVLGAGDDGEPTLREWSIWAGTIPHEVATGLGAAVRLQRRVTR